MNTVRLVVAATVLAVPICVGGCGTAPDPWKDVEGGPLKVLVSFPPLYSFAKSVAGPDAAVLSLLTDVGPHDHKPTVDDAIVGQNANLFLINGLELDDLVTKGVRGNNQDLAVIKLAEAIPAEKRLKVKEDPHHKHNGDCCAHGEFDPHAWLGIDEAIVMVNHIRDVLQKKDPQHHDGYQERAAKYVKELEALREYGKKALAGKSNRKLVTNHNSFRYFARSFGLEVVGCIQAQPGVPPDVAKLNEIIRLCQQDPAYPVRLIAVEPQYKRSGATQLQEQLASRDFKAEIVELDPLETAARAELDAGFYIRKMRANIDTLAKHLP